MGEAAYSDAELAQAYLDGDRQAVEQLFERYRKPFYAYLNHLLQHDRMSADDIFQELWIRILRKLPECRNLDHFGAWAFRIAHNLAMQHFRNAKRRDKIGRMTDDGILPEFASDEEAAPEAALHAAERRQILQQLLALLPVEQQEVFALRQQGLSFQQIAEIQKCPINTALGRMHYLVHFLRNHVKRGVL